MISQGAIGCFSRYGASFLGLWRYSLWALAQPQHTNASHSLKVRGRFCKALPCHFPPRKIQSNDTKSNFLAIASCQANWERRVCLESGDGRQVHVAEGGLLDWQWPCGRNKYLCVFLCVCVHPCPCVYASGSVCGIILENLSLWRGTDVDLHMWRVPSLWWD